MSTASARLERIPFKTSRLLDFVGRRELTAQIGHDTPMWPLVVLKESLDNALDACEEAEVVPGILVEVSTEAGAAMIVITDKARAYRGKRSLISSIFLHVPRRVKPIARRRAAPKGMR